MTEGTVTSYSGNPIVAVGPDVTGVIVIRGNESFQITLPEPKQVSGAETEEEG